MTMAFDTHEAAKEYGRAGFTEAQVEALVNVTRRTTFLPDISNLATKSDIADMATKLDIANMATKSDIANMATKLDIANMATKSDIANMATKMDIANMATKSDIANMATKMDIASMATKSDIANMATKTDFAELKADIASAKFQAVAVILPGMAAIMAVGTVLAHLLR